MAVQIAHLNSHSNTQDKLHLMDLEAPDGWREGHYLPDGEIAARTLPIDPKTPEQAAEQIKAKWLTFWDFLTWAMGQESYVPGNLDLSSLTSLPANAKLTAGGYVYLADGPHKI